MKNKSLNLKFSKKGNRLIKMYKIMVKEGYTCTNNNYIEDAFDDFELQFFREPINTLFKNENIKTILDYGCGGSNWKLKGFDNKTNKSAIKYFNIKKAYLYEPARNIDQRQKVDCVICFDVLEHIFISDIPIVIRNILSYAKKSVVLNIATYPAAAELPNGENAHITQREPLWWKGVIDTISIEYPKVKIMLICSTAWRQPEGFQIWNANMWQKDKKFEINY